jgi:hypothetical protein
MSQRKEQKHNYLEEKAFFSLKNLQPDWLFYVPYFVQQCFICRLSGLLQQRLM